MAAHDGPSVRAWRPAVPGIAEVLHARRLDLARRLLLSGVPVARTATAAGFHDQSHLTRHFRRLLGTSPGRYAAGR